MKHNFPFPIGRVHIIGIGGIGMSGYAEILHNMGYEVQGSDLAENGNIQRLRNIGVDVAIGHKAENIKGAAVVVKSTAVRDDNPEVVAAGAEKIPVIARVDLLAELMRNKWCVNISGTHGKTTTTSMIGHVLEKAGLDPTVINGGIVNAYGSNTRMGAGKWMVVEADESDGTFVHLPSVASIITNIDPEHTDHYGDFETLKEAFVSYAQNLPFYGIVIACIDHPVVAELIPEFHRRVISYGFSGKADMQAVNLRTTPDGIIYDLKINDPHLDKWPRVIKDVTLPMFGSHNVLNSLASFALGHEIGVPVEKVIEGLSKFCGVKRRFTTTGIVNGITVIDDYGHHPVEISAVMQAARDALCGSGGTGRVIAVMQPHRYTRLRNLFDQFARCFEQADEIVIADVYAAGETPIDGIDRDSLVAAIRQSGKDKVHALPASGELARLIHAIAKPGDFVICLGAGNITHWANALPGELETLFGIKQKSASSG